MVATWKLTLIKRICSVLVFKSYRICVTETIYDACNENLEKLCRKCWSSYKSTLADIYYSSLETLEPIVIKHRLKT